MSRIKGVDKFVVEREKETALHLKPGVFPLGRQSEWAAQNRTLTFALHPLTAGVAVSVAGKVPRENISKDIKVYAPDERVYFCKTVAVSDARLPFANDTHAVFLAMQSIMGQDAEEVGVEGLLRMSALYREAMLQQVRMLQDGEQQQQKESEFVETEVEIFQSMHAIWHLLEIIYLTTNLPGLNTSVVPYYMEWLNFNFPAPLAEDGQRIADSARDADALNKNTELWPYLKKLALRGHMTTLANMLEQVAPAQDLSAPSARWARELARVSREMPLGTSDETTGSFNARWRRWSNETHDIATAIGSLFSDEKDDPPLRSLFRIAEILRGEVDVISEEGELWQDVLGAILLYSEPTAQADRLPTLAQVVLEQFQTDEFTQLDRALVALINHDLAEFLVYSNQIDNWLSAHTSDIMDHLGILEEWRSVFAVDPRAHFLHLLGEKYLSHQDLWHVGLDYFGQSKTLTGMSLVEESIVRMPLESDRKAQKMLDVCAKYGLSTAIDRIHRQLGRQKWQRGRLGAAIGHFARVGDRNAIGQICDQLWAEYLKSGKLTYGPIIDGVMAGGRLRHDRLQFLTQYRDFHESYKAGDFIAAGRLLLAILVDETAPLHAIPDLLVDAIPLLEGDSLVFSADDTFELMRCAEALTQSPLVKKSIDTAAADQMLPWSEESPATTRQDELGIFNVACARNLARSFVVL
ncbi:Nucleoporin, Nup85-like protein [Coemansia reversa NRRL 1564]|uniref:Nuclear pore complex protein Nup85 n=1 Tax=Coemansia reversa (strain ATCC 12441 / NRRL 1564) TaxID=763665 RepID=A0A2G5B7X2_COERN|nr:Nucleoporin, Nup85-like protein [Coemansia reversa NRRL 1564]|eukprot:PIA15094.1 Nucleoporin, Nup85-like protein [Coemansia reversa NRRL 1564]